MDERRKDPACVVKFQLNPLTFIPGVTQFVRGQTNTAGIDFEDAAISDNSSWNRPSEYEFVLAPQVKLTDEVKLARTVDEKSAIIRRDGTLRLEQSLRKGVKVKLTYVGRKIDSSAYYFIFGSL